MERIDFKEIVGHPERRLARTLRRPQSKDPDGARSAKGFDLFCPQIRLLG
jgi:hypothetical protein